MSDHNYKFRQGDLVEIEQGLVERSDRVPGLVLNRSTFAAYYEGRPIRCVDENRYYCATPDGFRSFNEAALTFIGGKSD